MHHAEYFTFGEYIRSLRLTSELVDLREGLRSGFKSAALEPLLRGLCINMMQLRASYLCRGIEAVITGLTRKKLGFVTILSLQSLVNSHFFGILSEDFGKAGRQFSIKIP